jgi:DNA-3-methyladenine glycosylase II
MKRIETHADIETGLAALTVLDPRLAPVIAGAGEVPLRRLAPGFASLCSIIVSQQVSRASADAIHSRLCRIVDPLTPRRLLDAGPPALAQAGLSRPKQRTLLSLAARVCEEGLDLDELCILPAEVAMARLIALPGIGPWTAEIYLLFCAGHPDIFPARDLALRIAIGHALGHGARPDHREVARIAESWAPWRGVAARLFWAHYRETRGRDAAPAATAARKIE